MTLEHVWALPIAVAASSAHDAEIEQGGGRPRGSELLDGVFASDAGTTFERSRRFDVDRLDDEDLHTVANTIRERFGQQSVLTFERGGQAEAGDRAQIDAGGLRIETDAIEVLKLNAGAGEDTLSVADLSGTGVSEVDADLDRATVLGSDDLDQISVGAFGVLGPTYVRFLRPEHDERGGDDIRSASTDMMEPTLSGGSGTNTLIGGPGDNRLLGGPGFDDVSGGKGEDVVAMGGYFNRFTWRPGDGSDGARAATRSRCRAPTPARRSTSSRTVAACASTSGSRSRSPASRCRSRRAATLRQIASTSPATAAFDPATIGLDVS
jgi:hypothetical protein